jgi:hypothetical protein
MNGMRGFTRRRGAVAAALTTVAAAVLAAAPAAAQEEAAGAGLPAAPGPDASPPLAPDHWAVRAAVRAEALGLARGFFPPQRSASRAAVAAALYEAAATARADRPAFAPVAEGWWARFVEDFSEYAGGAASGVSGLRLLGGRAGVEAADLRGRMEPGRGAWDIRGGPIPVDDRAGVDVVAEGAVAIGRALTLAAAPGLVEGEPDVKTWQVTAAAGRFAASVGRQPVGYGHASGGGVVMSANAPLIRAEVQTPQALRPGGPLRFLGDVTLHTFATRLTESRHPGGPYLWGAHLGVRPHERFAIGINRGAIFGGDSIAEPMSMRMLAGIFVGVLSDNYENQVVSVDARWRLPTEGWLPAVLYAEWGAEDGAGAWWSVPGIVGGVLLPSLPGLPQVAGRVEHAWFATVCCGNPPWYLHVHFPGGWAAGGEPLGHRLGGEGRETRLELAGDEGAARLRWEAAAFVRHRSDEGYLLPIAGGNLYVPTRAGRSTGGSLGAALRVAPRVELRGTVFRDAGDGWREQWARAGASVLF